MKILREKISNANKPPALRQFKRKAGELFGCVQRSQVLLHLTVVDVQKLVATRRHVDVVRFPLGAFRVKEPVYGVIGRSLLEQSNHHQKKRFAQLW